jgi:hypothetical protein
MHAYYPPCALVGDDELVPINRPTVPLTPRGVVALDFYRWLDAVRALDAADQAAAVALALAELAPPD